MTHFEKAKLLEIYDILVSGRIEQARLDLEKFLEIDKKSTPIENDVA